MEPSKLDNTQALLLSDENNENTKKNSVSSKPATVENIKKTLLALVYAANVTEIAYGLMTWKISMATAYRLYHLKDPVTAGLNFQDILFWDASISATLGALAFSDAYVSVMQVVPEAPKTVDAIADIWTNIGNNKTPGLPKAFIASQLLGISTMFFAGSAPTGITTAKEIAPKSTSLLWTLGAINVVLGTSYYMFFYASPITKSLDILLNADKRKRTASIMNASWKSRLYSAEMLTNIFLGGVFRGVTFGAMTLETLASEEYALIVTASTAMMTWLFTFPSAFSATFGLDHKLNQYDHEDQLDRWSRPENRLPWTNLLSTLFRDKRSINAHIKTLTNSLLFNTGCQCLFYAIKYKEEIFSAPEYNGWNGLYNGLFDYNFFTVLPIVNGAGLLLNYLLNFDGHYEQSSSNNYSSATLIMTILSTLSRLFGNGDLFAELAGASLPFFAYFAFGATDMRASFMIAFTFAVYNWLQAQVPVRTDELQGGHNVASVKCSIFKCAANVTFEDVDFDILSDDESNFSDMENPSK